jgi:hypothetical protein
MDTGINVDAFFDKKFHHITVTCPGCLMNRLPSVLVLEIQESLVLGSNACQSLDIAIVSSEMDFNRLLIKARLRLPSLWILRSPDWLGWASPQNVRRKVIVTFLHDLLSPMVDTVTRRLKVNKGVSKVPGK